MSENDEKTRVTQVVQAPPPEQGTGNDCVVVIYAAEPGLLGKRYVLDKGPIRIGRGGDNQIVLEYTADRQIAINKRPVTITTLEEDLRQIFADRKDQRMFIVGDGSLPYGEIVTVIDAAKGAGVEAVGIVTEGMRRAGGAD